MSKQRWLLYSYEYPPLGGGVATSMARLLEQYQAARGIEFEVITSSISGESYSTSLAPHIRLWYLPTRNRDQSLHTQTPLNMASYTIRAAIKSWQLRSQFRLSGVHVLGYPGVANLYLPNLPSIISLWGIEVPGYNPQYHRYYPWFTPLVSLAWRSASKVVAISDDIGRLAQKTWPRLSYQVIPNGVDTQAFRPSTRKFPTFTVTAGGTILGSIKGLEYLIRGFAAFHTKMPRSRLLLIGDGPAKHVLQDLVAHLGITASVAFAGRQPKDWIQATLPRCHVLCLPSLNEGMSNALLEGMASGLAIITTDTGGSRTLLGKAGIIIEKHNHAAISQALIDLSSNPSRLQRLSTRARRVALGLQWNRVADEYLSLYRTLGTAV